MLIGKGLQVNVILGQIHRFWLEKRRCQEQNMPATAGRGEKSGSCLAEFSQLGTIFGICAIMFAVNSCVSIAAL